MTTQDARLSDTSVAFVFSSYFLPPDGGKDTTPCLATGIPLSNSELGVLLQSLALMALVDRGYAALEPFEEKRMLRTVRGLRLRHLVGTYAPGLEGAALQVVLRRQGVASVRDVVRDIIPECWYPFREAYAIVAREVVERGFAVSVEQQRSLGERLRGKPATRLQAVTQDYAVVEPQAAQLAQRWIAALPQTEQLRAEVRKAIGSRQKEHDVD